MPMIDVYAPADMFHNDADSVLAEKLGKAILRAEGMGDPAPRGLQGITGVYIHRLPPASVNTAATPRSRTVRVQVLLHPGGLNEDGQKAFIADATRIVAEVAADPDQARRTWVIIAESMAGGWGVRGEPVSRENAARLTEEA
jgi:phenylpyruvate tautomerase PptA (4-oxalocrotonate tautomerase family)